MTPQAANAAKIYSRYLVALSRTRFGDDEPPVQSPPADEGAVIAGCNRCPAGLMAAGLDTVAGKEAHAAPPGPVKCLLVVAFDSDESASRWTTAEGSKFDAIYRLPH